MSIKLRDIVFELNQGRSIKPGSSVHKAIKVRKEPEIVAICKFLDEGKSIEANGEAHKAFSDLVKAEEAQAGSGDDALKKEEVAKQAIVDATDAKKKADKVKLDAAAAAENAAAALKTK